MKINSINLNIINSPWPIIITINILIISLNIIISINKLIIKSILIIIPIIIIFILWIINRINEKINSGFKNNFNELRIKPIIIIIILSETIFFASFFYINLSNLIFNNIIFNIKFFLSIFKLNILLSFVNLIVLLNSSITFIIALKNTKINKSIKLINYTIILGIYFLTIQIIEYYIIPFNLSRSIFFSNFFILTIFHITHVITGIIIITIIKLFKIKKLLINNTKTKILCWYWHFVDLVWIWIFILIYL